MILSPHNVRHVRPIAENIHDFARLVPYLREAEELRLIDVIGAGLYCWLDTTDFSGAGPFEYKGVTITKAQHHTLMCGGYYGCDCDCGEQQTPGIIEAVAYIAYARFIMNNPINTTAFGVVHKNGEFSTRVDEPTLVRASNEANKIGEALLQRVLKHVECLGLLQCCHSGYTPGATRKLIAIGRTGKI